MSKRGLEDVSRVGLDKLETSPQGGTPLVCRRLSATVLQRVSSDSRYTQEKVVIHGCKDYYACEACRAARTREIRARLAQRLHNVRVYPCRRRFAWLLTFTLSKEGGKRYGPEARDRLSKLLNTFSARLSDARRKAGCEILFKLRSFEFHSDYAMHAHVMVIASGPIAMRDVAKRFESYGHVDVRDVYGDQGMAKALWYVGKYAVKGLGGFVPKRFRVASARFFAMSGRCARPERRKDTGWRLVKGGHWNWRSLQRSSLLYSGEWSQAASVLRSCVGTGVWCLASSTIGLLPLSPSPLRVRRLSTA